MSLATLAPIGPHVTGVIRFASEGQGDDFRQLDEFEVLSRVHDLPQDATDVPKLRPHPISKTLAKAPGEAPAKLQSIPVTLMFDKPENNLQARYEAFDPNLNRIACIGDGETCSRANFTDGNVESHPCKGPDACTFANGSGLQCQLHVRLAVQIDGQQDPLSVFEVQSGGIHTYRTLQSKLQMMKALLGGKLRHVPLSLTMYAKSSPAHEFRPFYVADLVLRDGLKLAQIVSAQKAAVDAEIEAGLAFADLENEVEAIRAASPLALGDDDDTIIPFVPRPASRARSARATSVALTSTGAASRSLGDVVAQARGKAAGSEERKDGADASASAAPSMAAAPAAAVVRIPLPALAALPIDVPAAAVVPGNARIHAGTERPPTPL
jgi:hypothetical protein